MKTALILLLTAISTFSFANEEMNHQKPEHRMGSPPHEAIQICVNQAEESACQITGPRGDTMQGKCKTTPDDKYFACMPERRKH